MSKDDDKIKKSKRRQKDENAVQKQVKIAKSHRTYNNRNIDQPHRLVKHHAMDCGNPKCYLCGNPRRTHKDPLTAQEHRLFQDVDVLAKQHKNGLLADEE